MSRRIRVMWSNFSVWVRMQEAVFCTLWSLAIWLSVRPERSEFPLSSLLSTKAWMRLEASRYFHIFSYLLSGALLDMTPLNHSINLVFHWKGVIKKQGLVWVSHCRFAVYLYYHWWQIKSSNPKSRWPHINHFQSDIINNMSVVFGVPKNWG